MGDIESKSIAVRGQLACLRVRPAFGHQKMGLIETALLGFTTNLAPAVRERS